MGEQWPRSWDAYAKTDHFEDVLADDKRNLSRSQVEMTLARGRQLPNDGNADVAFQYYDNGVYCYVLAGWDHDHSDRVLITAWNSIRNPIEAVMDGWTTEQIKDVYSFNDRDVPMDVLYPLYTSLF